MAILVEISPLDPVGGNRVTLRFADADDARITALNGLVWWPGVLSSPSLQMEGWDGDFSEAAVLANASLQIDPVALRKADPGSPAYRWAGAPVKIYQGQAGAAWSSWSTLFVGLIQDYSTDDSGRYSFSAQVDGEPFDAPLLSLSYLGTGGIEGDADLKEKLKPMAFGRCLNVEPILINAVDNVYQVHGYGAVSAIVAVYERAADLVLNGGSNVGDFSTYAGLVSATIAEGNFGTCLAQGLFRLGAPPAGLITADVDGDVTSGFVRSTAAIIARLCSIAEVPSERIDSASLAALDAAVPYPINVYLTSGIKVIDMIQSLVRPCNAQGVVSWTGLLWIARFGAIPTPIDTLDAQGSRRPPVLGIQEVKTSPPYHRIEMRGARCWRQQTNDEIAFAVVMTERGPYDAEAVYAEGDIVSLLDGSRWQYIFPTPGSGHAPVADSLYWAKQADATVVDWATGVTGDGRPDDNATVGAPAGTDVAGRPAESVLDNIDLNSYRHVIAAANAEVARLRVRALNYPGPAGESHYTLMVREATQRAEADDVFAQTFDLLGAVDIDRSAFVLNQDTVKISATESLAQRLDLITATFDDTNASVSLIQEALANETGGIARALLRVDVDGRVIGFAAYNDGDTGSIVITADNFTIVDPDSGDPYFYADEDGVKMHSVEVDTIKARAITGTGLNLGATGVAGFFFDDADLALSDSDWTTIASATITPHFGKPVIILANAFGRSPDSGSTPGYIRIVRIAAGVVTVLSGGTGGPNRIRVDADGESVTMFCVDGTVQGQATTYAFQGKRGSSGERILTCHRFLSVMEQAHAEVQSFNISAVSGEGPAAGTTGGGGVGVYNPNQELPDLNDLS